MTSKHESMDNTILPFHLGFQSERIHFVIPAYRAQILTPAGMLPTSVSFRQSLRLVKERNEVKKTQS